MAPGAPGLARAPGGGRWADVSGWVGAGGLTWERAASVAAPAQKLDAGAPHQLGVADRGRHALAGLVALPMGPGLAGVGVIDQLVQVGRHPHAAWPDALAARFEHRAGDHEHIALGAQGIAAGVFLDLGPGAAVVLAVLR